MVRSIPKCCPLRHSLSDGMRTCFKLLATAAQAQAYRTTRLEDTLALYGAPGGTGGASVWTKLAGKADTSRLERLEVQVDALQVRSSMPLMP